MSRVFLVELGERRDRVRFVFPERMSKGANYSIDESVSLAFILDPLDEVSIVLPDIEWGVRKVDADQMLRDRSGPIRHGMNELKRP